MKGRILPIGIFIAAVVVLSAVGWMSHFIYLQIYSPGQDVDRWGDAFLLLAGSLNIRAVITIVVLLAALFVILSKRYTATDKHWAYGAVGTLLGFWLKG